MSSKKNKRSKRTHLDKLSYTFFIPVFCVLATSFGIYQFVSAYTKKEPVYMDINPNIGLEAMVIDFFTANDAPEMIPIIKCESEFKHYNADGTILKNKAGSSATGISQILTSVHPDPKVLKKYNRKFNTNLTVADFDVTTVEGNLGYALMLYELRGTRDWECAKKFRFR